MNVGDEGDGEAVQLAREAVQGQVESPDAEVSELSDADRAEGDAGKRRRGEGGGGEECPAGNPLRGWSLRRRRGRVSR